MTRKEDAFSFSGFQGCASSREVFWHLASDKEDQWDRFPAAHSWKWEPNEASCLIPPLSTGVLVKHLVEQGGWLLLGDSMTENHFFSISCSLYPHVIATPNYVETPHFDRAWPQHLYLNPRSPLAEAISFPRGFNVSSTPLVTFRRVDLLFEKAELVQIYQDRYDSEAPPDKFTLFSDEATWNISPDDYLDLFIAPLPSANYATMIVSTGGHWTTTTFSGFRNENANTTGYGIDGVLRFFGKAMEVWAEKVQARLDGHMRDTDLRKEVLVRAYLPGHEGCHSHREPWKEIEPYVWNWFNWGNIWEFNDIFEASTRLGLEIFVLTVSMIEDLVV
ncbi:hypothetical protein V5O48_006348 [Marasmius crinis-equi]|uniref:Uncharacterized protein n=1 Tax=Marasmius crinis-equi TaxID=585013 RepID=A0ABR3FJR5_9AGAR